MATALVIATTLGVLPAVFGGDPSHILIALGVAGIGATLLALSGFVSLTWWAVGTLGVEYAVFVLGRGSVDLRAPIVGAGLLVLAELIQWRHGTLASRGDGTEPYARRLADLGMFAFASVGIGSLVLLFAGGRGPGNLVAAVVGFAAAVAMLGLVLGLATRKPASASADVADTEAQ